MVTMNVTFTPSYENYLIGYNDKGKRHAVGDANLKTAIITAKFQRRFYTNVSITKISVWPHRTVESSLWTIVGWGGTKRPVGFGVHKSILKLQGSKLN